MKAMLLLAATAAALAGGTAARADSTASRAAPCWQEGTTVAIAQCFAASAAAADAELNRLYRRITGVLATDDRRQLQAAERLWVAFRDASCRAEKSLWEGGTGGNPAYLACRDDETRRRLDYLRTTYRLRLQRAAG